MSDYWKANPPAAVVLKAITKILTGEEIWKDDKDFKASTPDELMQGLGLHG